MWWSEAARRGATIALALCLGACGFEPLYGPQSDGRSIIDITRAIDVAPIPDRLGQVVRNHLRQGLTPRGAPRAPRYRLVVTLRTTEEGLAFERDDSVTRYNVILSASYDLTDIKSGRHVSRGIVRSITAYNVVQSDYATISAAQDARLRLAREVSTEIQTRLSMDLARADGGS